MLPIVYQEKKPCKKGELKETSIMGRKLPLGIQGFQKLREENFLYVDKTEYIFQLVHDNVPFFLSRPRRFGKSLLLNTLKAYWEGKKDLFSGLAIEKLEEGNADAWKAHPVFYFDFNGVNYQEKGSLERALEFQLQRWEEKFASVNDHNTLGERFSKAFNNSPGENRTSLCDSCR